MHKVVLRGACLSDCGHFRYHLSRRFQVVEPMRSLCFVMLNPSTADADLDDPTIRKCLGFAQRGDYDGIDVVNLYAYRATKPADLKAAHYPVGPKNDTWITATALATFAGGGDVVCAWGQNASGLSRAAEVVSLLRSLDVPLFTLDRCKDGTPAHPLMLPYSRTLQAF